VTRVTDIGARDLEWPGCHNVRDLGGLPLAGGGTTVPGRIVRADNLDRLTDAGWRALWDYGVRTVIDLRNEEECRSDVVRPDGLELVRVPFDTYATAEWIAEWYPPGLPNNIGRFLEDYPQAAVDFGKAIGDAAPDGAVVVHCAAGRDRTGLASMLLLAHAGVDRELIAADYEHSIGRLKQFLLDTGKNDDMADPSPDELDEIRGRVRVFLEGLCPEEYFDEAVRARFVPEH